MPSLPKSVFVLLVWAFASSFAAGITEAQHRDGLVATHRGRVDRDFFLQGEYFGSISSPYPGTPWRDVGLQVVAVGDGRFDAVLYPGGLPGSGWSGGSTVELKGTARGGTAFLQGRGFQIVVESNSALVYDGRGQALGQIPKVQRTSPTLGALPPVGAEVLFDGTTTEHFVGAEMTPGRLLEVGTRTERVYRDYTLHLEFLLPYMPDADGQARANSGVYLQSRYEVQILDSFGLEGRDNECGALYRTRPPDINMCFPPLTWQTYDIRFTAPRFDDEGNKTADARITVWHNGVAIHNDVAIPDKTGAGEPEGPEPLPIRLQDHGNPVRFRNIWILEHGPSGAPAPLAGDSRPDRFSEVAAVE